MEIQLIGVQKHKRKLIFIKKKNNVWTLWFNIVKSNKLEKVWGFIQRDLE